MDLGIQGKRVLVIGGSTGLGLACAHAFAREGVKVAIFARNPDNVRTAVDNLSQEHKVQIDGFSGDVTSHQDVKSLRRWVQETGGIDILLVNTPRPPSPMQNFLDENDDSRWNQAYVNQLQSALFILRELTPLLMNKGWGRVIGLTSASVKQPMPRHAISSIFRAGVQAALKHLVEELAPHGVTVNVVAPATVLTPTFSQFHNLEARVAATPLKRTGTMTELGGTVVFLASQFAGYITGETIQFDGGMTKSLV